MVSPGACLVGLVKDLFASSQVVPCALPEPDASAFAQHHGHVPDRSPALTLELLPLGESVALSIAAADRSPAQALESFHSTQLSLFRSLLPFDLLQLMLR